MTTVLRLILAFLVSTLPYPIVPFQQARIPGAGGNSGAAGTTPPSNIASQSVNCAGSVQTCSSAAMSYTTGALIDIRGTFSQNIPTITATDNCATPSKYQLWTYAYDSNPSDELPNWHLWGIANCTGAQTITINSGNGNT